ncbi:hypothetical protein [Holzapfeliella sp. JNUCC 80]
MNTSQTELLKSAKKATAQKDYQGAVAFLEEAQNFGPNSEITAELIRNYLKLQKYTQALDELKYLDIYQNNQSFEIYLQVLYQNHLIIPFFQIPFHLKRGQLFGFEFETVYNQYQERFKSLTLPKDNQTIKAEFFNNMAAGLIKSRKSYEQLKKLPINEFAQICRTAFLAPGLQPELRVALIEDLVKLEEVDTIPVFILDKLTEVDLQQTTLYFDSQFMTQSIAIIQSEIVDPSIQQLAISQYTLLLAQLYPRFDLFIKNISEFVFSFLAYFGILGDEDFDKNDNPYFALIKKLNQSEEI